MTYPSTHAPQSTTEALRCAPHPIVDEPLRRHAYAEAQRCSTVASLIGAEVSYKNESFSLRMPPLHAAPRECSSGMTSPFASSAVSPSLRGSVRARS